MRRFKKILKKTKNVLILIKALCMFLLICRCSSVVEHVIGNDGVVSPILISGTSFLLSPYFKGFFYAFFQAIFNTNRHLVRQLSRQRFLTAFTYIRFPVFLPELIYKKNKTFARMHFYYIPEF